MQQHEMMIQAFTLLAKSDLFPDTTAAEIAKDILWLHKQGYLYASTDKDDKLKFIMCGYKVKKAPKDPPDKYPIEEEGSVFYIPWAISEENDANVLKVVLTELFDIKKDITAVAFHDLKHGEDLNMFKRKKEKKKAVKKAVKKTAAKKKTVKKTAVKKKTTKAKKSTKRVKK